MHRLLASFSVLALLLTGAGCSLFQPKTVTLKPITLEYWRQADAPEALAEIIAAYRKTHPNVQVNVTSFNRKDFQQKLLEALAEDRGPDLFTLENVDLRGWQAKLQPLPKETSVPYLAVDEKTNQVTVKKSKNQSLTIRELIGSYVETVKSDVVMLKPAASDKEQPTDAIYGLPFSVDSPVMFWNEALFLRANLNQPPATWGELTQQVPLLTTVNQDGSIRQSGVAIGRWENVRHYTDLLVAIMTQNGAQMTDEYGYAAFDQIPPNHSRNLAPSVEALSFYKSFAVSAAPNYSWNATMPDALDAFVAGKTAIYFGLPEDAAAIRAQAPRLQFKIAPLPQIRTDRPANVAHYPVEVVSAKSANGDTAWDFLQFATRAEQVVSFLNAAKRPAALRSLIDGQLTNPDIGAAAGQVLTAKSWYRGKNWSGVEAAFRSMINFELSVQYTSYAPIVSQAVNAVDATMR